MTGFPGLGAAAEAAQGPTGAASYWEERALRFARAGDGLAAICSYGMPAWHNRAIAWTQSRALAPWLMLDPGTRVLELGCGVGRWTRRLAAAGGRVTAIDLSPTMVRCADDALRGAGLGDRCRLLVGDVAELDLAGETFDLVLSVTVLQHVLDSDRFGASLRRVAAHLAPGGRFVLLEAAPTRERARCDTAVFRARSLPEWRRELAAAGLGVVAVGGVDPSPWRPLLLPHLAALPPRLGRVALLAATVAALPVDLLLGRWWASPSWHKVLVAERGAER